MLKLNIKCLDGHSLSLELNTDWSVKDLRAAVEEKLAGIYKLFHKVHSQQTYGLIYEIPSLLFAEL